MANGSDYIYYWISWYGNIFKIGLDDQVGENEIQNFTDSDPNTIKYKFFGYGTEGVGNQLTLHFYKGKRSSLSARGPTLDVRI